MSLKYRLVGKLETSELAQLCVAAPEKGPSVLVKLFHPHTSDLAYARSLQHAVRKLKRRDHPGIAHVLEVGLVQHRLAVIREWIDGVSLSEALGALARREVLLPATVALGLVLEVAQILEGAHQAGVVHGALTPGNVLMSKNGDVAVCDFGVLSAMSASIRLVPAAKSGRRSYRSPEVQRGEAPTVASDVYSLSALAYELLSLKEPWLTEDALDIQDRIPELSRLDSRFDDGLDMVLVRGMDPRPANRWKDCQELMDAIREWLERQGGVPSSEDVQQVVRDLYVKDREGFKLEAPPFTNEFTLDPLDESELATANAVPLDFRERPSFSNGPISPDDLMLVSSGVWSFASASGSDSSPIAGSETTLQTEPRNEDFAPVGPLLVPPIPSRLRRSQQRWWRKSWVWWTITTVTVISVWLALHL